METPSDPRQSDRQNLRRLRVLLGRARRGPAALEAGELLELPHLYRHACGMLAELSTRGGSERARSELTKLVGEAHALLHKDLDRGAGNPLLRALRFLLAESPRALRREWKLAGTVFLAFYGISAAAFLAVSSDLEAAYSLFSAPAVDAEIAQLRETPRDGSFRGNFTFGVGQSTSVAGFVMVNNIKVGVLYFGSGLVPPLYAFIGCQNALMLGTYLGVADHWGHADSISSYLWCHGVIEIQALLLAGIAGLVVVRALVAPGPWTRRQAMKLEIAQAWRILAPLFPLLVVAGLIEGYVTPHAAAPVRVGVALATGLALVAWVALGGRGEPRASTAAGRS